VCRCHTPLAHGWPSLRRALFRGGFLGFVRLVTQPLFDHQAQIGQAVKFIDHLLGSPTVRVPGPGSRHWELPRMIPDECQVRAGLVTDTVIVVLCHEPGVTMVLSNDRDFDRFPDIRGGRLGS
jgi:predicted nucleic acid-binding protein